MNLLKALATVSSMTLLSRILGFVRDFVIARAFGAGAVTDAFFVAFRLPNLLRRMFAEGAFSQAFVPILAEYKNKRETEETRRLAAGAIEARALDSIRVMGKTEPVRIYELLGRGGQLDPEPAGQGSEAASHRPPSA